MKILSALLFSCAVASAQSVAYDGKYADRKELQEFLRELPKLSEETGRIIAERLGLEAVDLSNVVLEVKDMPFGATKDVMMGGTSTRVVKGRIEQVVKLNPETHFNGQGDLPTELLHEMTHAVLRNVLGDTAHRALPKWAREGLAVWVAGQGPDRMRLWLANLDQKEDPVAELVNGLEGLHSLKDYPEDYLAIDWLEKTHGNAAVKTFVALLARGWACRDAAAEAAQVTWEEFEAKAAAHARKELTAELGTESRRAYAAALKLYRERKWQKAAEAFEALTLAHPESWVAANGSYYRARSLEEAGETEKALTTFDWFIASRGRFTGLMDDAEWHTALCLEKLGRHEEAVKRIDRLLCNFPFYHEPARVLLRAAKMEEEQLERGEAAKARYRRIVELFPASKEAGEARKKLP